MSYIVKYTRLTWRIKKRFHIKVKPFLILLIYRTLFKYFIIVHLSHKSN